MPSVVGDSACRWVLCSLDHGHLRRRSQTMDDEAAVAGDSRTRAEEAMLELERLHPI